MKAALLCSKGLEDYALKDLSEYFGGSFKANAFSHSPGMVIFETKDYESLFKYAYTTQIASMVLLDLYDTADDKTINALISKNELPSDSIRSISESLSSIKTILTCPRFRVSVLNNTGSVLDTQAIERLFGILVSDNIKNLTVDLKNPDALFYVIISNNSLVLALDLTGDLSKRDYRIFNSPMSIKGTTAYALLKIAGFKKSDKMLDTYCNSGTIAIEAALYANSISPKQYTKDMPFTKLKALDHEQLEALFLQDEKSSEKHHDATEIVAADPMLKNITAAKKNAKIAGVEKLIRFRRIDIDWMDIKHDEKHFDKIITFLPGSSKHRSTSHLDKEYRELFYQAEYILKENGIMAVLCIAKDLLIKASEEHFILDKEQCFYSGEQLMTVLLFRKRKKSR